MDCRKLEPHLDALLDGTLSPALRAACAEHLARCAACRDLAEAAAVPHGAAAAPVPPGFAAAVLARTSGPACRGARDRLGARVDGELSGDERQLVDQHLAHCAPCRGLAAALEVLAVELPRLAEVPPDGDLVADVLAATRGRRRPAAPAPPLAVRIDLWWQTAWPRWVRRPRFALEAAYVGALVAAIVFGATGTSLAAVPRRALGAVEKEGPIGWQAAVERAGGWVGDARGKLEESAAARTLDRASAAARRVAQQAEQAASAAEEGLRTWRAWLASLQESAGDDDPPPDSAEPTKESP